ncbi:DNA cytosine methyltransferase [Paenibacillus sp. FSL R5-0713]|uniref:DNA cytosine methyltransferase n=1 Tax=Paenibacillus sp. FSL R5-0713 TaxID=2921655 RepID=UPI0030DD2722
MRIVDLFSGAGGLTFGFYYSLINGEFVRNENCEIVFANEFDEAAAQAFCINFPDVNMIHKNIKDFKEEEIQELIGEEQIDLIIGGPPCQSFSTIGKRKYDDKAQLYNEYYRMLSMIEPRMFLFENVKGMLSMRDEDGNLVINDIENKFRHINEELGYNIQYRVLNAVNFGVPQYRERVFIIGIRNDLDIEWEFPTGLDGVPTISLEEAISDLPIVEPGGELNDYLNNNPVNNYQRLMRGNNANLTCHFSALYGEKIQTIVNHVIPGEGKDYINGLVDQGVLEEKYRLTSGYSNTYGRLLPNQPCTTITKNLSTPSGLRCIHYNQNRGLTPREGARIQSFPDWFQFNGNRYQIKTQIGNAVPPLLAMELANQIERLIG